MKNKEETWRMIAIILICLLTVLVIYSILDIRRDNHHENVDEYFGCFHGCYFALCPLPVNNNETICNAENYDDCSVKCREEYPIKW